MDDIISLQWIASVYDTKSNAAVKEHLTKLYIASLFSYEDKDDLKRLDTKLSLFYDPKIVDVYLFNNTYRIFKDTIQILIICDSYLSDNFIFAFYNNSPYDSYRSYVHCKLIDNNLICNSIPDFEGDLHPYQIISDFRPAHKINYNTYMLWNFDNRNHIHEYLIDGLLLIYILHRDCPFDGCTTLHCHNILSNKRYLYISSTKPFNLSLCDRDDLLSFHKKHHVKINGELFSLDID